MIQGVEVKRLKVIPDERGHLMEIMRCDDSIFQKFGQVYITTAYPGVIKAWHFHTHQTDYITVVKGMAKVVLYDARKDSETYDEVNEFFIGKYNPILVKVPNFVYHGFKGIGNEEVVVLNIPTLPYNMDNPDEHRIDPHDNKIPYDWRLKDR